MRANQPGADGVTLEFSGGRDTVTALAGAGNDTTKAQRILDALQAEFEVVTPRRNLPDDDPDKTVDPAAVHGEAMFWRGTDVVAREMIVDKVFLDGGLWHARIRNPNQGLPK